MTMVTRMRDAGGDNDGDGDGNEGDLWHYMDFMEHYIDLWHYMKQCCAEENSCPKAEK